MVAFTAKKFGIVAIAVFAATLMAMLTVGSVVIDDEKHPQKFNPRPSHTHTDATEQPDEPVEQLPTFASTDSFTATTAPLPTRLEFEGKFPYSRSVWAALQKSLSAPPNEIVPVVITPMFHDGDVLPRMLESINVPVRHFVFVWNSNDRDIGNIVDELKRIPFGITVAHNPSNFGFSASINVGLRVGLAMPVSDCQWYWVINCDVTFPAETMPEMIRRTYATNLSAMGMMYGPAIDHYAFIVTRRAVEVAGLMDENFYPAYFEDVDWRWRVNLAGFEELVMNLPVNHIRSHNLKKGADPTFMAMHHRHGNGWPYGAMKWGEIRQHLIHERFPPSGWKNPFGIDMPLDMWVIDPDRMNCLKTGNGQMHPRTGHCWYNGYKTLSPVLKAGTWFPECMKSPYPDAFKPR